MATAINIKRKNIDLPLDALRKLAVVAMGRGISLKKYIEQIVMREADTIQIEIKEENPSPSGDPWFDDPANVAAVMEGIEDARHGRVVTLSNDELKNLFRV